MCPSPLDVLVIAARRAWRLRVTARPLEQNEAGNRAEDSVDTAGAFHLLQARQLHNPRRQGSQHHPPHRTNEETEAQRREDSAVQQVMRPPLGLGVGEAPERPVGRCSLACTTAWVRPPDRSPAHSAPLLSPCPAHTRDFHWLPEPVPRPASCTEMSYAQGLCRGV